MELHCDYFPSRTHLVSLWHEHRAFHMIRGTSLTIVLFQGSRILDR